jgi:16S rRNA processing protein RimM
MNHKALCAIAVLTKAFGIKGELKLRPYIRTAEHLKNLTALYLGRTPDEVRNVKITQVTQRGEDLYITLEGIDHRSAAEAVLGRFLFVEEHDRLQLPAGSFFIDDLIGFTIVNSTGQLVGTLVDMVKSPAHKIYVVQTAHRQVMMPAVPAIVRTIDTERRVMTIDPPEGMFDGATA